jgi:hypothetical protein
MAQYWEVLLLVRRDSWGVKSLQKRHWINIHTNSRRAELLAILVRLSQSVLETLVQGTTRSGFHQHMPAIAIVELGQRRFRWSQESEVLGVRYAAL